MCVERGFLLRVLRPSGGPRTPSIFQEDAPIPRAQKGREGSFWGLAKAASSSSLPINRQRRRSLLVGYLLEEKGVRRREEGLFGFLRTAETLPFLNTVLASMFNQQRSSFGQSTEPEWGGTLPSAAASLRGSYPISKPPSPVREGSANWGRVSTMTQLNKVDFAP